MAKIYAEDLNYWKSGTSSPDTWITKVKAELRAAGGRIITEFFGADDSGRAGFALEFELHSPNGKDRYKCQWPVLPCRVASTTNERAARIQAATALYHDVKARCVAAKVLGIRAAFLTFLVLPDGRTAAQAAAPELVERFPRLLPAPQD